MVLIEGWRSTLKVEGYFTNVIHTHFHVLQHVQGSVPQCYEIFLHHEQSSEVG